MSDELKDFRYYADKAEAWLETTWKESPGNDIGHSIDKATVYAELAKAAPEHTPNPHYVIVSPEEAEMYRLMKGEPKAEPVAPVRCPEWLSRGVRDLPKGFIDYQCVLFAGHGVEHESSTGKHWLTEVTA